ncbi:MAG: hypothetical protein FWC22_00200 [Treponema sp.]|nr:hypothetical protein [Treponema sp.]
MLQDGERNTAETGAGININKHTLVTILVCTGISMLFLRTGILSILYLIPLGYAVVVTGYVWHTFFAAALTNIILVVGMRMISSGNSENIWLDIFYITLIFMFFTWIMGGKILRTAYRFILASAAAAAVFIYILNQPDSDFYKIYMEMSRIFLSSSDSAEMFETVRSILLYGGAVASMLMMFYINRQITIGIVWMIKKQKVDHGLTAFFAPVNTIWILIGSAVTILLTNFFSVGILEIIAWNILIICAIIYLVQGIGILIYLLARRTPAFRICINILLIIAILSPVGTIAVGGLVLLGIAENFRPIRRQINA